MTAFAFLQPWEVVALVFGAIVNACVLAVALLALWGRSRSWWNGGGR